MLQESRIEYDDEMLVCSQNPTENVSYDNKISQTASYRKLVDGQTRFHWTDGRNASETN